MLVSACSREAEVSEHRLYVFGTVLDISVWGGPTRRLNDVLGEVSADLQRMHRQWHAWRPGMVVALNTAIAQGRSATVDGELLELLQLGLELSDRSEGLFNPAMGRLIGLWGFHQDDPRQEHAPPPDQEIEQWLAAAPSMHDLRFDGDRVSSVNARVQLDLGGYAKGYAVDRVMRALIDAGFENAAVNAGGDVRARGLIHDRPWRIGIRHPQGDGILAYVEVDGDECVFTSGNYERFNEHEGVRYPHILDPRTGRPVVGISSATVIHTDGALADAAATALVVAGPEQWVQIARRMGIREAMLVDDSGTVYLSPEMSARLHFERKAPRVVVSDPLG